MKNNKLRIKFLSYYSIYTFKIIINNININVYYLYLIIKVLYNIAFNYK